MAIVLVSMIMDYKAMAKPNMYLIETENEEDDKKENGQDFADIEEVVEEDPERGQRVGKDS